MVVSNKAKYIRSGEVILFPTESFYALGADATNGRAVKKIFRLKSRARGKPIAVMCGSWRQIKQYFVMNKTERQFARQNWPGPVTLLLKPRRQVAAAALAPVVSSPTLSSARRGSGGGQGRGRHIRIGVRIPAHARARKLALSVGAPITATSANRTGRPPTKSAAAVRRAFPGMMIMPGRCGRQRRPSTVIEIRHGQIVVLRPGALTLSP
ncbi:MAG: L-threonylcarbamoyladenylate synthase [Candidatus Kerfeldbacteria bacterium]|nr:L-threonylcarbamoyladenylate synthase [Candidatus Kerfeldbacteria bacterium]